MQHRHQAEQPALVPRLRRRAVVETQVRVAVEDEKAFGQQPKRPANCAERSFEAPRVVAVLDPDPEPRRADPLLDQLSEVADAENDVIGAVLCEQAQLMQQERLPRNFEQRLRCVRNTLTQARTEAAGQNADRL